MGYKIKYSRKEKKENKKNKQDKELLRLIPNFNTGDYTLPPNCFIDARDIYDNYVYI